jgi:uncharacterized protein (TIGR03083 family)
VHSDDYLSHLEADGHAFAAAVAAAPSDAPVPCCPDWDVAKLQSHLTNVHMWVEAIVTTRAGQRVDARTLDRPESFEAGLAALLAALRSVGDDEQVWNWSAGAPDVASFWKRRMAQETAVHRRDAQAAAGSPQPIDPTLAADGIDEYLATFLRRMVAEDGAARLPGSLHLHTTDAPGEWTVTFADGKADVRTEHGKGDAAVRGPASDVLLWVWNRGGQVETFGDDAVLEAWRTHVRG